MPVGPHHPSPRLKLRPMDQYEGRRTVIRLSDRDIGPCGASSHPLSCRPTHHRIEYAPSSYDAPRVRVLSPLPFLMYTCTISTPRNHVGASFLPSAGNLVVCGSTTRRRAHATLVSTSHTAILCHRGERVLFVDERLAIDSHGTHRGQLHVRTHPTWRVRGLAGR